MVRSKRWGKKRGVWIFCESEALKDVNGRFHKLSCRRLGTFFSNSNALAASRSVDVDHSFRGSKV